MGDRSAHHGRKALLNLRAPYVGAEREVELCARSVPAQLRVLGDVAPRRKARDDAATRGALPHDHAGTVVDQFDECEPCAVGRPSRRAHRPLACEHRPPLESARVHREELHRHHPQIARVTIARGDDTQGVATAARSEREPSAVVAQVGDRRGGDVEQSGCAQGIRRCLRRERDDRRDEQWSQHGQTGPGVGAAASYGSRRLVSRDTSCRRRAGRPRHAGAESYYAARGFRGPLVV